MAAEVEALQDEALRCDDHHNAYLESDDATLCCRDRPDMMNSPVARLWFCGRREPPDHDVVLIPELPRIPKTRRMTCNAEIRRPVCRARFGRCGRPSGTQGSDTLTDKPLADSMNRRSNVRIVSQWAAAPR